ncbi:MAG: hypothetical protein ACHQQS_08565 [Thermoanaerobaculales bacterium]
MASKKTIAIAALVSIGYHLGLSALCLLRALPERGLGEFWLFVGLDSLAIFVILIPLVAVLRKELRWYDPIALIFLLFLYTNCTFLLVFIFDPRFVRAWMAFGSGLFQNLSSEDFFLCLCEARVVLLVFLGALLATNARSVPWRPYGWTGTTRGRAVALVVALVCVLLGIVGFFLAWPAGAFAYKVVHEMGSATTSTSFSSNPRFLTFINIGIAAVPLGLAAWLGPRGAKRPIRGLPLWIAIAVLVGSVSPHLAFGSRITVVIAIVSGLMILGSLGVRIERTGAAMAFAAAALLVGAISLARGNPTVQREGLAAFRDLSALATDLGESRGSPLGPLLDADRTAVVALIVEATSSRADFVWGESLLAGPGNLAYAIAHRLTTGQGMNDADRPILQANERIALWRFGHIVDVTAVPPSYPGEFYMQGGYPALLFLSVLFGWGYRQLRVLAAQAQGLFARFMWLSVALAFAMYSQTESSVVTPALVLTLLPIAGIYGVTVFFFAGIRKAPRQS